MARKSSPTILQEELYPPPGELPREELKDTRLLDLDVEEPSPFLRGQKRVSARRAPLPKKALRGLKWVALAAVVVLVAGFAGASLYRYGQHNWRFRIASSDDIEITGTHNVTHAQVMEVMGGDIGRNIFFIPLAERRAQLEKIPWVESASVMRFVPHRLHIEIHERTPVAFARVSSHILLTDAAGTLMELPGKQKYSFPVILGINPGEPPSTRVERLKIYNQLVRELDSEGSRYSQDLSEVDLSDPNDLKVVTNDPGGAVLVHLGGSDFLARYKIYITHIQAWRQQFDKLESVNLGYDHQIVVNPDQESTARLPQLSPAAARAAMAAGVKPAALIHVVPTRPATPPRKLIIAPEAAKTEENPKPSAKPVQPRHATSRAPRTTKHKAKKASAKSAMKSTSAGGAIHAGSDAKPVPKSGATQTANARSSPAAPSPANSAQKPSPAIVSQKDQAQKDQGQKNPKDQEHP